MSETWPNQPAASQMAREAFDHWEAGRLEDSAALYERALKLADPDHYSLAEYHGEFAGVLESLGRPGEALAQLELAVGVQRRQDGTDSTITVATTRYFLADHLVRHNEPARALEVIAPSLIAPGESEWILRLVEAEALAALHRPAEARHAAKRAVGSAPSPEKAQELADRFAALGLGDNVIG